LEYIAIPGWRAILRGRGLTDDELKPADREREAEDDVKTLSSDCGDVVDVYCPGSNCTEVSPCAESVSPTNIK
jgi:hypothetical protein